MNPIRKDMELLSNSMATYAHITGKSFQNSPLITVQRKISNGERQLAKHFYRFGPRLTPDPKKKITTHSMDLSVLFDLASHV